MLYTYGSKHFLSYKILLYTFVFTLLSVILGDKIYALSIKPGRSE